MIAHAYVPHPVWKRDQCEFKYDDDGRAGFCGKPRSEHQAAPEPDPLRWEAVDMSRAGSTSACHEVHDEEGNIVALCFQMEDAEHIVMLHNAALAARTGAKAAP